SGSAMASSYHRATQRSTCVRAAGSVASECALWQASYGRPARLPVSTPFHRHGSCHPVSQMRPQPELSIVIPAYNEEDRLTPTLRDYLAYCGESGRVVEM